MKLKLNDLEIDSEWTSLQLEEFLKKHGERANIAVTQKIITDCGDDGVKLGFKIHFNQPYPKGSIILIQSYRFDPLTQRVIKMNDIWRRNS